MLKKLFKHLPRTFRADRHGLRKRLQSLEKRLQAGKAEESELLQLAADLETSIQRRRARAERLPVPAFPPELPVSQRRDDIAQAIRDNQVVVVAGETGSGKTTQLPKICLAVGRGTDGFIGCTQPRRIAARSIAARVATELGSEMGQAVGFKVRFSDRFSPDTYIKLMTDGILLAEMRSDRYLDAYDTLIIDEAHERNLNTDFILGYLKQLLPKRPDLKIIITSATIDTARFAAHFNNAPVISVEGRTYPVELRYRPLKHDEPRKNDKPRKSTDPLVPKLQLGNAGRQAPAWRAGKQELPGPGSQAGAWEPANRKEEQEELQQAILEAVDEISRDMPGDILVFLPGERDIRETAEALRKHHPPQTEILPLYARLSAAEQNKVFQPHGKRRIVLATNVAETSLTVPGIRAVVDPGLARLNRYSVRSKVQRLQIEKISRASADQRKGRCGRVGPGLCIRLYSEADYLARMEFTPPEILRASLAAVILRMLDLRLGEVDKFPFLERPDRKRFNDGFKQLQELGAVNARNQMTDIGRQLAKWPIDPRIGRMILAAKAEHCLTEVLIIAAALSVQDPRERPLEAQQAADQAHAPFKDEKSDFISYLKLWQFYSEQAQHLSHNKLRKLCITNFLSHNRMREWRDIHQQLFTLVREQGWKPNEAPAEYDQLHRALLSGLLGNIACRDQPTAKQAELKDGKQPPKPKKEEKGLYLGPRSTKLYIFPGSALFKRMPKWITAAELAETTKLYARTVAQIEPEWIEKAAGDLCRRTYAEAHWEKRAGQVAAFEQVTLYGLTIIPRRKINYGPIAPKTAHEIFIRGALVAGEFHTQLAFFHANQALIREIENLEHKARRLDILVDEQALYDFYAARIPAEIYTAAAFEQWYRQAAKDDAQLLYLSREDLTEHDRHISSAAFPDTFNLHGMHLPLRYHFAPGDDSDGVTVSVPVAVLAQLNPVRFEWLVPGLLEEKITGLIRSLPKQVRKHFVPAPNFAQAACEALQAEETPLCEALGHYLARISGVTIPAEAWATERLAPHLFMRFEVSDEDGQVVGAGRHLSALQAEWQAHSRAHFAAFPKADWEREGMTAWECGDLPERLELRHHEKHETHEKNLKKPVLTFIAYPALADENGTVALRLFDEQPAAAQAHRGGVRRLFLLAAQSELRRLRQHVRMNQAMCSHYAPLGNCEQLKNDFIDAVIDAVFLQEPLPRTAAAFDARVQQGGKKVFTVATEQLAVLRQVLEAYHRVFEHSDGLPAEKPGRMNDLSQLKTLLTPAGSRLDKDIKEHLDTLMYPGFVRKIPFKHLQHLPRYLEAVRLRLDRRARNPQKDAQKAEQIAPFWRAWRARPAGAEEFRWLLEEFRVSLFAQELRTACPVSVQRLERLWAEVEGK